MQEIYNELTKKIDISRIYINELMKNHTSFKIGGPADLFIKVNNIQELNFILKTNKKHNMPITIIGNGSNVLVSDKGIRGIVINLNFNNIKVEGNFIIAEAGAMLSKVANVAYENSLSGCESIAGIPGTIGGAIKMNAGAYGQEMKNLVVETTYLDNNLEIKTINNYEHKFSYRKSIFSENDNIIIATKLQLEKEETEKIKEKMKELFIERKSKQPLKYPSAGSVFKRGENFIAAELIDKAGLKGYNVGDAYVSEKHAGFIINKGEAKAKDVVELIKQIKKIVYAKFNKELELELKILGEE